VKRIKVSFAGLEVEFVDRERALEQVRELGERGTFPVYVVYGPEGCGKTALLRQAKVVLEEEYGYHVIYTNPLAKRVEEIFQYSPTAKELVEKAFSLFSDPLAKAVDLAINVAGWIMQKFRRSRVAVLMDDIFQAVGVENAEAYVKALLNLIEWPPAEYDKIVVLIASREGVTRERVGRHSWADIFVMWNMSREGFEELYKALPDPKPSFDEVWRLAGGSPRYLENLYRAGWNIEKVVKNIVEDRKLLGLVGELSDVERQILGEAIEDPDTLFRRYREAKSLINRLTDRNLIVELKRRDPDVWIDQPPPERDPDLGIGRYFAWQTPLHREAVKKALESARGSLSRGSQSS